jgi:hypothetical protein
MVDLFFIIFYLAIFWVGFGLGYFASILKGKYKPILIIWLFVCSLFAVLQELFKLGG